MSDTVIEILGKKVTMREMKVRDERAVKHITDDADREFALLGNLTGLSEEELDDLTIKDYRKLQDALLGFFV